MSSRTNPRGLAALLEIGMRDNGELLPPPMELVVFDAIDMIRSLATCVRDLQARVTDLESRQEKPTRDIPGQLTLPTMEA